MTGKICRIALNRKTGIVMSVGYLMVGPIFFENSGIKITKDDVLITNLVEDGSVVTSGVYAP